MQPFPIIDASHCNWNISCSHVRLEHVLRLRFTIAWESQLRLSFESGTIYMQNEASKNTKECEERVSKISTMRICLDGQQI